MPGDDRENQGGDAVKKKRKPGQPKKPAAEKAAGVNSSQRAQVRAALEAEYGSVSRGLRLIAEEWYAARKGEM